MTHETHLKIKCQYPKMKLYWKQPHSFVYVFFVAAFMIQQNGVVAIEMVQPAMPKWFTFWPFPGQVVNSFSSYNTYLVNL